MQLTLSSAKKDGKKWGQQVEARLPHQGTVDLQATGEWQADGQSHLGGSHRRIQSNKCRLNGRFSVEDIWGILYPEEAGAVWPEWTK